MVTEPRKILVVEDQPREREAMSRMLRSEGFQVASAGSVVEAMAMADQSVDLVVSDLRLGDENAIELLEQMRHTRSNLPFIVVTAFGDVSSAVNAMKLGAIDYLAKPLNPTVLLSLIRRQLSASQPFSTEAGAPGFENMLGQSAAMRTLFERIRRAAHSDCTVLITGESGTGKELVAAAIHRLSRRVAQAFVTINISELPVSLIEAELFGVCKGAYTGATHDRDGMFASAHRGTLFLDEVGELPLSVQPKLLRVLEGAAVTRIGSREPESFNVRVVLATHRNLHEMVRLNQFRNDLWHRINVLTIELPALRERREDIPLLFSAFLSASAARHGLKRPIASRELESWIESYDWPGNVRQLRNVAENLVVMSLGGELGVEDLSGFLRTQSEAVPDRVRPELRELERNAILNAIRQSSGSRTLAAESLGISVRTLQRKLKLWGLSSMHDETDDKLP
jgi:DNA-binding NtrC family response regulator